MSRSSASLSTHASVDAYANSPTDWPWPSGRAASPRPPQALLRGVALPAAMQAAVWHGDALGQGGSRVRSSGWSELDAELPGGGWPLKSATEILAAQPSVLEWRLLAPALTAAPSEAGPITLIGPPQHPHLPGLRHIGLDERRLVWIQAETAAERLWATEQVIKSNAVAAVIAWVPQARQEQIRRLQVCALSCDSLVFLFRPEAARYEPSAAPLRLHACVTPDWELKIHVFKRRGPSHEAPLTLASTPGGLSSILTPRLREPSRLISSSEATHAVDCPVAAPSVTRPVIPFIRRHARAR